MGETGGTIIQNTNVMHLIVHHVGILYDQFMMHGQRNIKLKLGEHLYRGELWGGLLCVGETGGTFVPG